MHKQELFSLVDIVFAGDKGTKLLLVLYFPHV